VNIIFKQQNLTTSSSSEAAVAATLASVEIAEQTNLVFVKLGVALSVDVLHLKDFY